MLRELITKEEYEAMDNYRHAYMFKGNDPNVFRAVSMKSILSEWAAEKENLFKLLGNNLILSRKISYIPSKDEFQDKIKKLVSPVSNNEFIESFINWCHSSNHNSYMQLIKASIVAANAWLDDIPLIIDLPNGKKFKVIKGTKPLKALGKIAAAYDIPGFEEFRIQHSMIFNNENINGELSLSIHPFDYWTMSDNNSCWHSCMNWTRPDGCYRQGTVEMMNSPIVIIAYLSSSVPFKLANNFEWNNKKWRQLFIVDKNIICGIKGYPYQNNYLTQFIINWIAELAKKNLRWNYAPEMFYYYKHKIYQNEESIANLNIFFETNYMYNDFDTLSNHWCRLGSEANITNLIINYSGSSECVCCGSLEPSLEEEGALTCSDCDLTCYCSCCQNAIYDSDDLHYVNGEYYCPDCYSAHFTFCSLCAEDIYIKDNEYYITIVSSENEIYNNSLSLCSNCFKQLKKKIPIYQDRNNCSEFYVFFEDMPKNLLPCQTVKLELATSLDLERIN